MTNKFQPSNFKSLKLSFLLSLSVIIFLAAGCNKQQTSNNQQNPRPVIAEQTQTIQKASSTDYSPKSSSPPVVNQSIPKAGDITVTQRVEGSNLNKPSYQIANAKTALDLLKSSHTVKTKVYAGIGEFVESIDGVKPDSKHFWAFYVNGVSSNVGASSYNLKNNDKIEWKLSAISNSGY